ASLLFCRSVCIPFSLGSVTLCFFLQAEDGIRVRNVTGVQTCALPISLGIHPGDARDTAGRREHLFTLTHLAHRRPAGRSRNLRGTGGALVGTALTPACRTTATTPRYDRAGGRASSPVTAHRMPRRAAV